MRSIHKEKFDIAKVFEKLHKWADKFPTDHEKAAFWNGGRFALIALGVDPDYVWREDGVRMVVDVEVFIGPEVDNEK